MTRDEVIKAVEEVDARVTALRARFEAQAENPLPTGTCRVRDALSHLAARSNPVPRVLARLELQRTAATPPPRVDIDEINHGQVEERADRDIVAILDELQAGHRETIASLPPDDVLAQTLPTIQGDEVTIAETIARSGARHEMNHLNDIAAALKD